MGQCQARSWTSHHLVPSVHVLGWFFGKFWGLDGHGSSRVLENEPKIAMETCWRCAFFTCQDAFQLQPPSLGVAVPRHTSEVLHFCCPKAFQKWLVGISMIYEYLMLFNICYIRWFIDTMLIPIGCCDVYTSWHTFKSINGPWHFLLPGLAVHSSWQRRWAMIWQVWVQHDTNISVLYPIWSFELEKIQYLAWGLLGQMILFGMFNSFAQEDFLMGMSRRAPNG